MYETHDHCSESLKGLLILKSSGCNLLVHPSGMTAGVVFVSASFSLTCQLYMPGSYLIPSGTGYVSCTCTKVGYYIAAAGFHSSSTSEHLRWHQEGTLSLEYYYKGWKDFATCCDSEGDCEMVLLWSSGPNEDALLPLWLNSPGRYHIKVGWRLIHVTNPLQLKVILTSHAVQEELVKVWYMCFQIRWQPLWVKCFHSESEVVKLQEPWKATSRAFSPTSFRA